MINNIEINSLKTPVNKTIFCSKNNLENKKYSKKQLYIAGSSAVAITALSFLAYRNHINSYKVKLAKDLSKELCQKITTKHLKSVMTKAEMLKELPKLEEQNYVASKKNLKEGIFLADLHSHSNYSDGKINVENLLIQAAEYGDKLQKQNGKKFIFALSDHDGISGTKEALKIIAKNPEKYKNIKFIPAAEVSFVLPCQNNSIRFKRFNSDVQMPEMLVYGINPFSETTEKFFNGIYHSREIQLYNAVNEANSYYNKTIFSIEEYKKLFTMPGKEFCFMYQHWNISNYMQTKLRIINIAQEQNKNPEKLFETIINEIKQNNRYVNPYILDNYLKSKNIQTKSNMSDEKLKLLLYEKIFPKKIEETIVESKYELTLQDIVNYAKEENTVLGFAHPGFTMQNFDREKCLNEMQNLIKIGQGRIKFSEKYHQAYPIDKEIGKAELKEYNAILDKLGLINIGGRDNHSEKFIPLF